LLAQFSFAQPKGNITYETKMVVAEESAENADYQNAIDIYAEAYKESRDKDLLVYAGDLAMLLRHYDIAEKRYEQLLKRDRDNIYPEIRLDLAKALKYQGKYKEALNEFNLFLETATSDTLIGIAKRELEGINQLGSYAENIEAVISFENSKINSSSAESAPAPYIDGSLYYSSFNRKKTMVLDGNDEEEFAAKIYYAKRGEKGEYDDVTALDETINREGFHAGGVSFSNDGQKMFFTRATLNNNELATSKIYVSYRGDNGWGAAREIPALNGDFVSKHPVAGELFGREVLFFASDMPGGYGKFDLYYSTVSGDTYSTPVNLGESINTNGNEITPFYKDGTLYFSTDARPSMGGYDIFYAVWNGTDFTGLTNMGYNYNSSADDMFLRFDKSGRTGYLVSNRPDKDKKKMKSIYCCDDIYSLVLRDLIIDLNALVVDTEDGMIDGATVELIDLTAGGEPTSKTNFTANNFNFLLDSDRKYKAVITHPDYYPDSTSFNTLGIIDDYSVKKTVKLKMKPKEPETEIVSINQPIRLNNIYYDFDDTKILSDAERDLNVLYDLMEEYPDMVIELSSHTDSRGTTPYNKDLSQRRANSAKEWLVREGIASERIQPVGYGESKLVNGCSNGVRCTEEEHQLNRRTEFKIIAGPQTIEIKREIFKGVKPADEEYQGSKNSLQDPKPIIKIENNNQDLGELKRGTKVPFEFKIENVGDADLIIEVVSTCKCTEIEWPTKAIKPGEKGVIRALYDTTFQHAGATEKIVDIIANTDPIVVEARFKAFIKE
jgi:peptidoglycan-associated lipoprotein